PPANIEVKQRHTVDSLRFLACHHLIGRLGLLRQYLDNQLLQLGVAVGQPVDLAAAVISETDIEGAKIQAISKPTGGAGNGVGIGDIGLDIDNGRAVNQIDAA